MWVFPDYGVLCLGGNWHVVEENDELAHGFRVLTTVEDRQTAIGFLKLIKEN
jgi:hypothetical protein